MNTYEEDLCEKLQQKQSDKDYASIDGKVRQGWYSSVHQQESLERSPSNN